MTIHQNVLLFLLVTVPCIADAQVDPTRPVYDSKKMQDREQISELQLSAVFISSNGKHAVINGKSYSEGESLLAYKVASISPNQVELVGPQGKQLLFIHNNNVKKEAENGF